jgi:hypothetical protein
MHAARGGGLNQLAGMIRRPRAFSRRDFVHTSAAADETFDVLMLPFAFVANAEAIGAPGKRDQALQGRPIVPIEHLLLNRSAVST